MTKEELIKILEPFSDDIQIVLSDMSEIVSAEYTISHDGEGIIVLSDKEE